mgnify:CR=1 FL=1
MRICLMIEGQEGVTWPDWCALADACEEHGVFRDTLVVFTTDATRVYRLETSDALGISPDVWTNSVLGTFAPDPATVS